MSRILLSGLINIETTLRVDSFPLTYEPVRFPFFGINSTVSGVGLGSNRALLAVKEDNFLERIVAESIRPIVNTIGAGDALFSSFVHTYENMNDPYDAIRKAVVFASYKIGTSGAAAGFLTADQLEQLVQEKHETLV